MTRREIIMMAMEKRITWLRAADILRVTPRHMRRLRRAVEKHGLVILEDRRSGRPRRKRIAAETVTQLCKLRREKYEDFSIQHFYEFVTEKHGLTLSYTMAKSILQAAGLAEKAPGRGKHRRKRERRPMIGMMVHMDGSTHQWIEGLPMQDLVIMLDDADGKILYGKFVEQEGTRSTLQGLMHVFVHYGRFCELYSDRGSHFCNTTRAQYGPDEEQRGQVPRVLKTLGIRQILARSPQARGRSERAFGTIQGRLPQELKLAGIRTYEEANRYLQKTFIPAFNRRFTVKPQEPETAFTPLVGIDLKLLVSVQHERVVRSDNTLLFSPHILQLPENNSRAHFVRCPVIVHEFLDGTLGISYQHRLLAQYTAAGELIKAHQKKGRAA
jgi:hypothetical protein